MNQPWQLKCAIDTAKAVLPFQPQLRRLKDTLLGYERRPGTDANTIREGLRFIEWLGDISGATVLEIGTGWQPMIPILFTLAGAKVYMTDLHRLMRNDTFAAALAAIRENATEIAQRLNVSSAAVEQVVAKGGCEFTGRLRDLGLTYLAPCDCRRLDLPAASLDVVTSHAVLEHVPPHVIRDIFLEAKRLLRPGGRMIHLVDHSDHWSHRDRRITGVNFLQYSDRVFQLTCVNPQNYQNRLRHPDYLEMLRNAGFTVTREQRLVPPACLDGVRAMKVAPRFRELAVDDLATTESIFLAEC